MTFIANCHAFDCSVKISDSQLFLSVDNHLHLKLDSPRNCASRLTRSKTLKDVSINLQIADKKIGQLYARTVIYSAKEGILLFKNIHSLSPKLKCFKNLKFFMISLKDSYLTSPQTGFVNLVKGEQSEFCSKLI